VRRFFWLLLVTLVTNNSVQADIGTVSKQNGSLATIKRESMDMKSEVNFAIESNDVVTTQKDTSLEITFVDDTDVKITENSRLVIDDFVFDPNQSDAGKASMRVAMGTVRYASGQIAKANPQRINIGTPSANIAVRGTDFHMTVDEAGRTLVILVPSCTDDQEQELINCQTGKIIVENAAGKVELQEPYVATYISNFNSLPNPPVGISLNIIDPRVSFDSQINNNLIISPPNEIQEQITRTEPQENEEEQFITQTETNNNANESKEKQITDSIAYGDSDAECSGKIKCVKRNPYLVMYRETENEHYAEVRMRLNSNMDLSITHNGDKATQPWGPAPQSGNKVTITQGK